MKRAKKNTLILIGGLLAVAALGSLVVTEENEFKLIRQFGRIERVISSPGLNIKVPFVQTADTLPKEILLYDLESSEVITKDKKTMICDSYVLWKITEPQKFAQSLNGSLINAEGRIDPAVYNSIKTVIGNMNQNEVISSRKGELSEAIMSNIGDNMEEYGLRILSVETKRLDLPSDNKAAVYERMISERDKIAATYRAEGASEAKVIENGTDREIAIAISDAEAKAAEIMAQGEAEYMRILAEAYGTPEKTEFYAFTRSLEAARNSLKGSNNTLILPANSPIAEIFTGQ